MDEPLQKQLDKTQQLDPISVETTKVEQAETLREHLINLQNWDTSGGQTVEQLREVQSQQMITRQMTVNGNLQTVTRRNLPLARTADTAEGQPQQVQTPAKKTYKERQQEKKHVREARKNNPAADHLSYNMVKELKEVKQRKSNSFSSQDIARVNRTQWDGRMMDNRAIYTFVNGYDKDKSGAPATQQDARHKARDAIIVNGLSSTVLTERAKALDLVTNEMLSETITDDMLTAEYIGENFARMGGLAKRFTAYQDLYSHPHNKAYFDAMPQERKDLIETRILSLYAPLGMLVKYTAESKAVNYETGEYFKKDDNPAYRIAVESLPMAKQAFREQRDASMAREKELMNGHLQRRMDTWRQSRMAETRGMIQEAQEREELSSLKDLGLTAYVTGYSFDNLSEFRNLIETRPPGYTRNTKLVDQLYHELHHSIDALGDLTLETRVCQDVYDDIALEHDLEYVPLTHDQEAIRVLVDERLAEANKKVRYAQSDIKDVQAALEFFLKGKSLNEGAMRTFSRLGVPEDFLKSEQKLLTRERAQEQLRKALCEKQTDDTGKEIPGYIEQSNQAYHKAKADGEADGMVKSLAFQALMLRSNGNDASSADKLLREPTYQGYSDHVIGYIRSLEDQNVDLDAIANSLEVRKVSSNTPGAYACGEGINAINAFLMDNVERMLSTEDSIQYLATLHSLLKDADVFEGSSEDVINFLIKNAFNRSFISHTTARKQEETFKTGESAITISREADRTMLAMPSLYDLTEEEQANVPAGVLALRERYSNLLKSITARVTALNN